MSYKQEYKNIRGILGYEPSVLALDPGESTGWCFLSRDDVMRAGTAPKEHLKVAELFSIFNPDIVVYETFNLYPSKAQSLIWNSFYPCEVIGVIKYKCMSTIPITPLIQQTPAVKRYAGILPKKFAKLAEHTKLTEHSKDACQHLCYFLRQVGAINRVFD